MIAQVLTTLGWYAAVTALGWLAWPLAYRLLPGLPDRGYALSRALGLLLTGYVYWLLGVLGLLNNSVGGILFAVLLVAGAALWINRTGEARGERREWLRANRTVILTTEVLFAAAFFGWAAFRAANPEVRHTEKPMELAFLNGVRLSPAFPPRDPWLAGYAISYYYFGYIIVALLADLTGAATGVAFNLGIALLFALTLIGAFGAAFNLIQLRRQHDDPAAPPGPAARWALLGPLFVGVMGNLEGLFELLRALNTGGNILAWLDVQGLEGPAGRVLWPPSQWGGWWWFHASRVIHDRTPAGESIGLQPIDEFPFFSFLLGDMHPHVLALPFVLLALMLALNLLAEREPQRGRLRAAQAALYVVAFGALAFLNTWDLPIYLFILISAMALRRVALRGSFDAADLTRPLAQGAGIGVVGLLAYLPCLLSFSSQAGGVLPNALFPTRLHQFAVMFGPLLAVAVVFTLDQAVQQTRARRADWSTGAMLGVGVLLALVVVMVAMSLVVLRVDPSAAAYAAGALGAAPGDNLLSRALAYRLSRPLTALLLTGLLVAALAALLPRPPEAEEDETPTPLPASTAFALLLVVTGALLTLGPEFVYLRDNFGQRLNTIFKFYYAAWIVWGVAAAYGSYVLLARRGRVMRVVMGTLLAVLVLASLVYTAFAIPTRASEVAGPPTLDGTQYVERERPGDAAAIRWLRENAQPDEIVLEAVGGAYSDYGRVSAMTGLPTLLGWANHERQWRGELYGELAGTREQDIHEIYDTPSIERALALLEQYDVTYVFVGSLEQNSSFASPAGIAKFERFLTPVYRADGATIYRADQPRVEEQA
ncbi:MAG TPA: DUF2298 domain-containing protein [Aggregatilineales bacterium]|nr:DUF2298 domain-containing protein [Aggregatilineales bacterium]